jgi:uroporphyrin-III C-methyltransferase/precorrin-2 dehydrogenase/sirohydrochlorin ferrochelatase
VNYFPAFLDLKDRPVLLVGGGELAARRLRLLAKAGARVTVVSAWVEGEIAAAISSGEATAIARGFVAGDVKGRTAVFAASGDAELDRRAAEAARLAGVPVNVMDSPDLSSFIVPAIVERDPVVIGISTGGASPVLARRIRERIESALPARLGALAEFAERFRAAVKATLPDAGKRLRFWDRFFDSAVASAVLAGDERIAREKMLALVNGRAASEAPRGAVAIVGAGPGDPDLLTFRALRLMQQADVVVHDKLIGPAILDYARRDAERVFVGKTKGQHSKSQDEINELLAELAGQGKRVVRLKGGDPFVFGRGGEELRYLRARGIDAEVVPGITAALGCGAAAGIPLTHREFAQAATFVTAEGRDGEPELDWAALAKLNQTVVIYMGVAAAGRIAARLIEHGLAADTPAAIVENGTLPDQKTAIGTVAQLETLVRRNAIAGPAVIVVGEVVNLADAVETPARALAS